jgi:hypothetical protein
MSRINLGVFAMTLSTVLELERRWSIVVWVWIGVVSTASADAAKVPLPGKGTSVTVVRSNGFTIEGKIVSMSHREVRINTARSTMTLQGKDLREVRTPDDTLSWNAKTKSFDSAKVKRDAEAVAAADNAFPELSGTWYGYIFYVNKGFAIDLDGNPLRPEATICVLNVDSGSGRQATGRLSIPEFKFSTTARMQARPLTNASRKDHAKNRPHFSLDFVCDNSLPLPGHDPKLTHFPLGTMLTNQNNDGIFPAGPLLIAESKAYSEAIKNATALNFEQSQAFAMVILSRQPSDPQRLKQPAALSVRNATVLFGPKRKVSFIGEINNPTQDELTVTLLYVFTVDNEAPIFNRPHQQLIVVRIPPKKSQLFSEQREFTTTMDNVANKGGFLNTLGKLLLATYDHVPHVRVSTAAVVGVTSKSASSPTSKAGKPFEPLKVDLLAKRFIPNYRVSDHVYGPRWKGIVVEKKSGGAYRIKITDSSHSDYASGHTYDFVETEIEGHLE